MTYFPPEMLFKPMFEKKTTGGGTSLPKAARPTGQNEQWPGIFPPFFNHTCHRTQTLPLYIRYEYTHEWQASIKTAIIRSRYMYADLYL